MWSFFSKSAHYAIEPQESFLTAWQAGTHTPCPLDGLRSMGPRFPGREKTLLGLDGIVRALEKKLHMAP